ncbi:hypothetical protein KY320_01985 [Candidatus Woesearchaeota archaeon]|nr:hypothetical protein [Candidatus Woesearchaeota archaeon]
MVLGKAHSKFVLIWLILIAVDTGIVQGIPPVAAEYYGMVVIDGKPAPVNTLVTIKDSNDTICGMGFVGPEGKYNLISCNGDDLSSEADEGALPGEGLSFFVNDIKLHTHTSVRWHSGAIREVNLVVGDYGDSQPFFESPGVINLSEYVNLEVLVLLLLVSIILFMVVGRAMLVRFRRLRARQKRFEVE